MHDPLTMIPNRRKLMEFGRHETNRALRNHSELHVLMIDIDHFKRVNDLAGHQVGDRVLALVAKSIKKHIRSIDVVGRLGGEEFAVVIPESNARGVLKVASRICRHIEQLEIPDWTELHGPVTVSIGYAGINDKADFEDLLKAADKALYHAKRNGRNQVIREDESAD